MTTRLTFPASMFSVVCHRCGSTMRKNADSCPNCGADRAEAFGQKTSARANEAKARGSMFEQQSSAPLASAGASMSTSGGGANNTGAEPEANTGWGFGFDPKRAGERIAQKAAEHRSKRMERVEQSARNAYADPAHDPDALPGSENWNQRKTIIAAACAVLLAIGAVFYLQHGSDDTSPSADHSVSGAIDSKFAALTGSVTGTPSASNPSRQSAMQAQHALSAGDPLMSLRTALDQHDLVSARARLKGFNAQQQARPEFEALKDELVRRELQRDAALQLARACERTSAWACVQQNAGEALSVDGGNVESQAMLERVIEHAGWAAGTNPTLAKKALAAPAVTNAKQAAVQNAQQPAQASLPDASNNAQANVPAAPPSTRSSAAQRRAQRNAAIAAARQSVEDDASVDNTEPSSRADKLARAQAATNALTAATVGTPATTPTPTAPATPTTPAAQTATAPATPRTSKPQYLGQSQTPAQSGAQYLESPSQNAPAAPMYSAPAHAPAAPHAPQYMAPSSSSSSSSSSLNNAHAQDAVAHTSARRVPVQTQALTQTQTPVATTTHGTQNIAAAAPAVVTTSPEQDKTEALERAIKQYGWSGSDSMPKPAQ